MTTFEKIRQAFLSRGYFTIADISLILTKFDKNNLTRWCEQGWIVRIKNGVYVFPEHFNNQEFRYFIANIIYQPSYVSLHAALAYHGYLTEQPNTGIVSVSTLKTQNFRNALGRFHYQTLKPELLFGYGKHTVSEFNFLMAYPEKALLDLLYLYPTFYNKEQDFRNFAIESAMLYENFDLEKMFLYLEKFQCSALERRVELFVKCFELLHI